MFTGSAFWGSTVHTVWPVASVRADVRSSRRIILSGVSPDEAEKTCLLAEILGWDAMMVEPHEFACSSGAADLRASARLVLRQPGTVIVVETSEPALGRQLARMGLDRLVLPVPVQALEQLLVFAG